MEEFCRYVTSQDGNDVRHFVIRALDLGFALVSIIALIIVAVTIFNNKKLSEHPSPLIARICIAEAILIWGQCFRFLDPKC